MPRSTGLVILVAALAACESSSGSAGGAAGSGSAVAAAPAANPNSGFSSDLAKKLDKAGSGTDMPERTNSTWAAEHDAAKSGSGSDGKPAEMKGADAVAAADPKAADPKPADAKATDAKADPKMTDAKAADAKVVETKPADGKPADAKPADAKPADPKIVETKPADTKIVETKPADTKAADAKPASTAPKINGSVVISSGTTPKGPISVPAELKAINIALLPNWDRDVEAAGTISLAVKIPGKTETATFVFGYGYEDPKAPADRDAYKKWLADQKIFVSKDDRQKGTAWYLEGVDPAHGKPAFRMVTVYGGKKLVCYGSLYKDSSLGDLRDQTIIQAKQICETLTL